MGLLELDPNRWPPLLPTHVPNTQTQIPTSAGLFPTSNPLILNWSITSPWVIIFALIQLRFHDAKPSPANSLNSLAVLVKWSHNAGPWAANCLPTLRWGCVCVCLCFPEQGDLSGETHTPALTSHALRSQTWTSNTPSLLLSCSTLLPWFLPHPLSRWLFTPALCLSNCPGPTLWPAYLIFVEWIKQRSI